MEIRKVQISGGGSFFITLPIKWIKEYNIEKGEDLVISQGEDGGLKLNLLKIQKKYYGLFVIQIEDYPEAHSLERCINSCYIQGADVIEIASKSTISIKKKNLLKNTTVNLIGTEVSEELSNKITIRILVDPIKFPLYNLIKRIYKLVSSMHLDAMQAFKDSDDDMLAKDVINREKDVDKLFFLILRQLNLTLTNRLDIEDICISEMKIDCVLGIVLARDLSRMAHYGVEIAKQAEKLQKKEINPELKEHLIQMSSACIKMQQNAILAFFKTDFMRANGVLNNIHEIIEYDLKTENEVLTKVEDVGTAISLITISRNLRNIANSAVAVSQDLQAKHRPKETYQKELDEEEEDLLSMLMENI